MNKKINLSYLKHDSEYRNVSNLEWCKKRFTEYEKENIFDKQGFKKILEDNKYINIHVDIGSGGGWLLINTAPIFKKVIGIEPSAAAIEISKYFTSKFYNVEYLNTDMIGGYKCLNLIEPIFFTSSVVFSHIDNATVIEFLTLLNNAPLNSKLYFFEPYDKNKHQYLWYIRNKEWWAKHLPNWQLYFHNYGDNNSKSGISGQCVGQKNVKIHYKNTLIEKIIWHISGIPSRIKYVLKILVINFQSIQQK